MNERPWRSISLPAGLVAEIKEFIGRNPGYSNTNDFIKEAIRYYLRHLNGKKESTPALP